MIDAEQIFIATQPIDLRAGINTLKKHVFEQMQCAIEPRALFVFFGKRRYNLKILFDDGTGMCVLYKRLDKGTFPMFSFDTAKGCQVMEVSPAIFESILHALYPSAQPTKPTRKKSPTPRTLH